MQKPLNFSEYLGTFSSSKVPVKIEITQDDENLILNATGQPSVPLEDNGNGKFSLKEAGLTLDYNPQKTGFILGISGQSFEFTKN